MKTKIILGVIVGLLLIGVATAGLVSVVRENKIIERPDIPEEIPSIQRCIIQDNNVSRCSPEIPTYYFDDDGVRVDRDPAWINDYMTKWEERRSVSRTESSWVYKDYNITSTDRTLIRDGKTTIRSR